MDVCTESCHEKLGETLRKCLSRVCKGGTVLPRSLQPPDCAPAAPGDQPQLQGLASVVHPGASRRETEAVPHF